MPTLEHDALVQLLREPRLVSCLLRSVGIDAVEGHVADVALVLPDMRCDVVAVFGTNNEPELAVVVEVQRAPDDDKWLAWPYYEAAARARHRCDACVLVVATTGETATWARSEARLGPLNRFRAVVIGPEDVPPIADDESIRPSLAILGAITQARSRSPHAIDAAIQALRVLPAMPDDQQRVYWDLILTALDPKDVEELMRFGSIEKVEYTSEFARKYVAEGKAEGITEGERHALYTFLRARGISISAEVRTRIDACTTRDELERLIERAATAKTTDDLF